MDLFFYHIKGHFNPAPLINLVFGRMKDSIQASSTIIKKITEKESLRAKKSHMQLIFITRRWDKPWQKLCDDGKVWRTSNSPKEEYNIWMTQSSHNAYLQIGKNKSGNPKARI